jgi:ABC-2 type transport system ATP-binding protein
VSVPAQLAGVWKSFGHRVALAGVDLVLEVGTVTALLGPNGAGKTTALRVLLGLRRPDAGTARLAGLDPCHPAARRRCGITLQETDLPETLRVVELVEFVRAHYARPLPATEVLDRFGLRDLGRRQAGGLSGGQRRRLAVALAFAGAPDVVVLDEPSAGLDADSRRRLWECVRGSPESGPTVLLTTHDLAEAEALADRIVVLSEGEVVLSGSVAEIRALAGHTRVRVRDRDLATPPSADRAVADDKGLTLYTRDAGELVRELVAAGADLDGLEVMPVSLEQALLQETG